MKYLSHALGNAALIGHLSESLSTVVLNSRDLHYCVHHELTIPFVYIFWSHFIDKAVVLLLFNESKQIMQALITIKTQLQSQTRY